MDGPQLLATVRVDTSLPAKVPSHIMIAGATGEVGRLLVCHLSASGVKHISCLVRDPEAASAAALGALNGVELVKCADVANANYVTAAADRIVEQTGVPHSFVSCMGISRSKLGREVKDEHGVKVPAGEQYVVAATNLIRAAKRIGVQRYVYISSGFVTRPKAAIAVMLNNFGGVVLGYHAVVEDIIREEVSTAPCMDYVIVRPGGLDHGGPGDGVQITQGDKITGGSVRRSRVAEVLAQTLNSALLPRRHGSKAKGVTLEVAGSKKLDAKLTGKINSEISHVHWSEMLGKLDADPAWALATPKADHLAEHRAAVKCCRIGCSVCCLLFIFVIVLAVLAGTQLL